MKFIRSRFWAGMLLLGSTGAVGAEKVAEPTPTPPTDESIAFSLLYRADLISNLSGGLKRGTTALGLLDAKFDFDLEALLGWDGATLGLHGIATQGGEPNGRYVGSSQGVNNIETDTNTVKLFQAWIQKQWLDDTVSARLGLYDLNSEFYVSHSTGIFLHPSPGIGSEFGQTGQNGPSIFPTTSMGLRLKYHPTTETYVQAVVLDGVPGDPNNPRGTHIQFNDGDGTLRVAEVGYIPGKTQIMEQAGLPVTDKYAVGAWSYTSRFPDLVEVDGAGDPLMRTSNSGFYALAEKILFIGASNTGSHIDGFMRYGRANADINPLSSYFQTGLVFTKMIPGRDDDQFAFSYSTAHTGEKYRLAVFNAGQAANHSESIWEMTYRARLADWLVVQPNLQYVINPGPDALLKNATVLGVRFELSMEK